jgi:hypothetical protein
MKKILALILATLMVMCALVACGPAATNGTTAGAGTTTPTTGKPATPTDGTTGTTAEPTPPEPVAYKTVVFYTMGEEPKAIDVAKAEKVGKIVKAGEGIEAKGGYFYVAEVKGDDVTLLVEAGSAFVRTAVSLGTTNKRSPDAEKNPGKVNGGSWWKTVGQRSLDMNMNLGFDAAVLNEAMGEDALGEFGTMTFTMIASDMFVVKIGEEEETISDANVKFVYLAYDGSDLATATGKEFTYGGISQADLIRYACDKGAGKDAGFVASNWQAYLDNYGAPYSQTMCQCDVCGGQKSLQDHWQNEWFNGIIPVQYNSALTNFNKIALDAEQTAKDLAAADAALAAAQTAFDNGVAANAAIKALKDDMDAKKVAYDTANAANKDSQETKDAKAAYDAATKAYNDAVAADATCKALLDTLNAATAAQKAATTTNNNAIAGDTNAELYTETLNKWRPLYQKFLEEYAKAANVALWDKDNLEASPLYQMFKDVEEDNRAYPTYAFYYDKATDTYTIFVTSATDANVKVKW